MEVLTVRLGDARYEQVIGQIRDDPQLLADMWRDAEHELHEVPGKTWSVVLVDGTPVAWAAARTVDGTLVCSDNYERRGVGRTLRLWPLAYRRRHDEIVAPSNLTAITYLFHAPIALHEADGWHRTGRTGPGEVEPHQWWELLRSPTVQVSV